MLVEVIARRLDDLGANPQHRRLPRRAHPQMAMLHQEIDAVLLGRDGVRIVRVHTLHDLRVGDVHLVAAGRALVGADFAGDDHARFLGQALDRVEQLGRDGVLGHHALDDAAAVAKDGEQQLAALAQVVEPAAKGDGLAFMLADFADGGDGSFGDFCFGRGVHEFPELCSKSLCIGHGFQPCRNPSTRDLGFSPGVL